MSREFLLNWRQSLLMLLDLIERELGITPRTAELRAQAKRERVLTAPPDRNGVAEQHSQA